MDNRPYYVALNQKYAYVRGLNAAYVQLAIWIDGTTDEVRERRKRHNCPGLIKRVSAVEARAAGI